MASLFESLPPEIVQKCVEFLDFDLVSGDLKAVSKATRGVARRALTRGRWKPIRYVAAEGLAVCAADDSLQEFGLGGFPVEFARDPPPAACATFREAWALDPALVIKVICDWDTSGLGAHLMGVYQGRFLSIVEPPVEGLGIYNTVSRMVPCLEAMYLIRVSDDATHGTVRDKWNFFPFVMLRVWWTLNRGGSLNNPGVLRSVLGSGLEAWSDAELAAKFTGEYLSYLGYWDTPENIYSLAKAFSDEWSDRTKADVYMTEMAEVRERIARQPVEDVAREWEEEEAQEWREAQARDDGNEDDDEDDYYYPY